MQYLGVHGPAHSSDGVDGRHLGGRVRESESLNILTVSPLVLMGSFTCGIKIEFRYCSYVVFFIHTLHVCALYIYNSVVPISLALQI